MAVRTILPVLTIKIGLKKPLFFGGQLETAKSITTSAF
jgi:hypothetical protein